MKIRYVEPSLTAVDKERAECLVLTAFADERPLRGLAGRVDWRLNGRLSGLMKGAFIDAHFTETMLTPLSGRLPFKRLLFVGMGERSQFDEERFGAVCATVFRALAKMRVTDFAMALPGRLGLDVGVRQALKGWEEGIIESFPAEMISDLNICIVEGQDVQRELLEPMRRIAKTLADQAVETVRLATAPQPEPRQAVRTDAATLRRRDWSTGMVRFVEQDNVREEDVEEIAVADVPESRRRSGLFTIPKAPPGSFDAGRKRQTGPQSSGESYQHASARGASSGPTADSQRSLPLGPSLPRRPSGQWAAVRRSSLQYDIPNIERGGSFDSPPLSPPSEPVDRIRRAPSGVHAALDDDD